MKSQTIPSRSRAIACAGAGLLTALLVSGCERQPEPGTPSSASAGSPASEPGLAADGPRLPVSLNMVMVALVNQAADPLWVAAWHNPETERDWRNLGRLAVQLELAGALLVIPGTGPMDEAWANNPDWQAWAGRLQQAGLDAVAAVQARDTAAISSVGDQIVAICEGCHNQFKPDVPAAGSYGEPSPSEAEFEDYENR